jgi:hypothetical protein
VDGPGGEVNDSTPSSRASVSKTGLLRRTLFRGNGSSRILTESLTLEAKGGRN